MLLNSHAPAGWYKQYAAHKEDFIERYGNSTEQWLFHGNESSFFCYS
jgi:hypothetical protein